MKRSIRVLIVEDSEKDTDNLVRRLEREGYNPEVKQVFSSETIKDALNEDWEIIFANASVRRFGAKFVLREMNNIGIDTPCIAVADKPLDDRRIVELMQSGARDYFHKMKYPHCPRSSRGKSRRQN